MAEKKDAWGMGRTQEKHGDPEPHDAQGAPKPNEAQDAQDSHGQLPTALVLAGGGSALGTLSGGNGEGGSLSLPRPFAHRICLIEETRVAGTTHAPEIEEAAEELTEGRELRFVREPGNLVDKWAIQVYAGEHRIGYAVDHVPVFVADAEPPCRIAVEDVRDTAYREYHKEPE